MQFAYAVDGIIFLTLGLFVEFGDIEFIAISAAILVPSFLLLIKVFPNKNRSYKKRRQNMKNYGPSGLSGLLGVIITVGVFYIAYSAFSKSLYSSIHISFGVVCFFNFLYFLIHITRLEKREEIFIV